MVLLHLLIFPRALIPTVLAVLCLNMFRAAFTSLSCDYAALWAQTQCRSSNRRSALTAPQSPHIRDDANQRSTLYNPAPVPLSFVIQLPHKLAPAGVND